MSDATLDQESIIVRIWRDIAMSEKLTAEREKLPAEREKLFAEALKPGRERWLAPSSRWAASLSAHWAFSWRMPGSS